MSVSTTSRFRQQVFRPGIALQPWLLPLVGLAMAALVAIDFVLPQVARSRANAWLTPLMLAVLGLYFLVVRRRTLTSDDKALHYRSNLPRPLQGWDPDWSLAWRDVREARWLPGPQRGRLRLEARGEARVIAAFHWQVEHAESRRCQRAMLALSRNPKGTFDTSVMPLVRELRDRGIDVPASLDSRKEPAGFDLAKNPATRAMMLVGGAAVAFWFVDSMVSNQMYGARPPWIAIVFVASLGMIGASLAQARTQVPAHVNVAVTELAGVSLALASYAGLQRLNQLAERDAGRSVEFILQADGSLRPDEDGATDLPAGFFGDNAYWQAQRPGSRHRFGYHDALGFETLDIAAYRARLRGFYGRDPGRDMIRT